MTRFKLHFIILFFIVLNSSYSQEKIIYPLKGLMHADDGYIIGVNIFENTIECFITDSLKNKIPIKKLKAALILTYIDKTEDFKTDLEKGKNNVFFCTISKEKPLSYIGIMIKIKEKQYDAAFAYPSPIKN
jgi:hypothetical protein